VRGARIQSIRTSLRVRVATAIALVCLSAGPGAVPAVGAQRGPIASPANVELERQAKHDFETAKFYFAKRKAYVGAKDRLLDIAAAYPEFTRIDEVYFLLAECFAKTNEPLSARHFFEVLIEERPESEFAARARKRLEELPPGPSKPAPPDPGASPEPN
jgi:TolA-binding protein